MKRIYSFILLLSFTGLVSCEKFLEVEPTNVVSLTTYDDVKALMGSYLRTFSTSGSVTTAFLNSVSIPYRTQSTHMLFGFYCDELNTDYFTEASAARTNHRTMWRRCLNWNSSTYAGTIWAEHFTAIGFLNTIIYELDNVSGGTQDERNIVKYEAKVLRAWYLLKLQQYFSPYHRDDLGIPWNFDPGNLDGYDSRRRTQTEGYATIISELEEALACETKPRETYNIFYDKRIINAILAQLYHFKGESAAAAQDDYRNAVTHATAALQGRKIMGIDQYEPFFTVGSSSSIISKDCPQGLLTSISYSPSRGMYGEMHGTVSNYHQYAWKSTVEELFTDNDIRMGKYFLKVEYKGDDEYRIIKYDGVTSSGSRNSLVFNFFSYSDLHLIVAESYARMGNTPEAVKWLEEFQKERFVNYTGFTGADVLEEILLERRRELFMEYDHRWLDLVRRNKAWSRSSVGTDANNETYYIEEGDYRYCFPIPQKQELDYNRIPQNPGWGLL